MAPGYYRFPTLHEDTLIFVCEDDLWTVPTSGGIARRLTANLGEVTSPCLSPDGSRVAFVGREEGQPEVFVMPARGGPPARLTFQGGSQVLIAGWSAEGQIIYASPANQPFRALLNLYSISPEGGEPSRLNYGPARAITFGPGGAMVIGRNIGDPARWKRYRGGTAGQLWIDPSGSGEFHPLINLKANLASPMWLGERIYFLSDHEGVGNLYSCLADGSDLQRHSDHNDFYARNASSDGRRIVYHAGADLYLFDPASGSSPKIEIDFYSPQVQRNRKFVDAERFLNSWSIHPHGVALSVQSRSYVYSFFNWEGPVIRHGEPDTPARYRLADWLNDGRRLVAVSDAQGEEVFVTLTADGSQPAQFLPHLDIGRPEAIVVNPKKNQILFSNHRYELCFLDLDTHELKRIDKGKSAPIAGFDWSPDGEWAAYSVSTSNQVLALKLWKASSGEIFSVTQPVLRDVSPSFDPSGRYLYFLSYRVFDPVADNLGFDLGFPRGVKPYAIILQKDTPSPFTRQPRFPPEEKKDDARPPDLPEEQPAQPTGGAPTETAAPVAATSAADPAEPAKAGQDADKPKPEEIEFKIDLEGIERRVVEFPTREGRFGRVQGSSEKKIYYSLYPIEGSLNSSMVEEEPNANGVLLVYDLEEQKEDNFLNGISDFQVAADGKNIAVRCGNRLRVLKVGPKPNGEGGDAPGRKSGWVDMRRLRVPVIPGVEWNQMYNEAWRLQRDQYWTADMAHIDWLGVHDRYLPLVERVSSRSEFSDLVWEMQGELSTSHCYELGGDYRPGPRYSQGQLGADFSYDAAADGWRVTRIAHGDAWDEKSSSPLERPTLDVVEGDLLLAINGHRLGRDRSPNAALVNLAGTEVSLTFAPRGEGEPRNFTAKPLGNDGQLRYREWVNRNRELVHQASGGQVGYLHIPDMSARGYAEFHRGFLAEVDYPGLIVDLRFNAGGSVSALLLEKLARKRIGYDVTRWSELPNPYPAESVRGPIVALTNEHAGSDGDIFSHAFKLMGLGPLVGKRTWGGVVGIWPRHSLVDGTVTTQPEFSFWFKDVGWGVENYGTDPDIEIDNTPQDYARGVDAQLERTLREIMSLLASAPAMPEFVNRPNLAPPELPKR
jgi:tricorn protease